ncbi:hypothetical protein CLOSCI_00914 [[Clostridium] scindens ATCC 35704]|nr:hypothetical protein CLOSCI_00914 [[Clostridium] scindens ATCC 35704]
MLKKILWQLFFLTFFHNHPVKSIDFLSLCEKTNLISSYL